jgi:hypothetical protein
MSDIETIPDLYRLAFIPGAFRCPKCGFALTKTCINARTGEFGTREQERESEPCPNDGTMLVHVTYKEVLAEYDERLRLTLADERRIDWMERFIESGLIETSFELDGGIHLTMASSWGDPIALRCRNSLREAIDSAIKGPAEGPKTS